MKKFILLFILCSSFAFSQSNVDFVQIIKNKGNYFDGKKGADQELKIKFDSVYLNVANENEIFVEGFLESGINRSKISGKISFNKKMTKKLNDPTIYNFDVILNEGQPSEKTGVFSGTLNLKIMPKLFNVIVFEGIWLEDNTKYQFSFDNYHEITSYLESLKK